MEYKVEAGIQTEYKPQTKCNTKRSLQAFSSGEIKLTVCNILKLSSYIKLLNPKKTWRTKWPSGLKIQLTDQSDSHH